jgi:SMP-30/Gluconolactonase/LRE-like region
MKWTIFTAAVLMGVAISAVSVITAAQSPACAPSGGLNFICGMQAVEDLVAVPNTRWLIGSGMTAGSGLHLIDTQSKMARSLFSSEVSTARADKTRFANCPAPLDPKQAVLHGLSLRPAQGGGFTLYATNHGGRESIEVFEVDPRGAAPSATWIGCVLLPDKLAANSVAAFSDGALVATVLTLPGKTFQDAWAGRNTGVVLMWTPGSKDFRMLPGTELPANNGIETSSDGREFYVASSGLKRIVAYSRADSSKPLRFAQLKEFAPDNVRLDGNRLVTAGMIDDEPSCGGAPKKPEDIRCPRGWIADAVDPKTMAVTEIARGPVAAPYSGTATAVQVGDMLWLSSFSADRIAYRPLKK